MALSLQERMQLLEVIVEDDLETLNVELPLERIYERVDWLEGA